MSSSGSRIRRWGLLAVVLVAGGDCTPARDGYYSGTQIAPPNISGAPIGVQCTTNTWRLERTGQGFAHWYGPSSVSLCGGGSVDGNIRGLWETVARTGFGDEVLIPSYYGALGVGVMAGAPDFVFAVSRDGGFLFPGPAPSAFVDAGAHLFRRTCSPPATVTFDEVDRDTPIVFDADGDKAASQTPDPFPRLRCGYQPPASDLGSPAARLLTTPVGLAVSVAELAWSPESDVLFVLRGVIGGDGAALYRVDRKGGVARQIRIGDLDGPVQVGAAAETVILTELTLSRNSANAFYSSFVSANRSVVSTETSGGVRRQLSYTSWPSSRLARNPTNLLSHDGKTVVLSASTKSNTWLFIDVSTLVVTGELPSNGVPLLWRADDGAVLISGHEGIGYAWVTPSGEVTPTKLEAGLSLQGCFQEASGPRCVNDFVLVDGITGQKVSVPSAILGDGNQRDDGARASFNDLTAQSFAWSANCLGLGETSCDAKLERFSWRTETRDVVAHASHVLPYAISPDGHTLATLDDDTVFIKELP